VNDSSHNSSKPAVLNLTLWTRRALCISLLALAAIHLIWPELAIDAVFLGLLALAALLWFFDVESIEWQGIRARRREIARAKEAIDSLSPPPDKALPLTVPALRFEEPSTAEIRAGMPHSIPIEAELPYSPIERLFRTTEEIRIELIVLAGNGGYLPPVRPWDRYSILELSSILRTRNLLPLALVEAIATVVKAPNGIAHAGVIDHASDLALDVLAKLRMIPRNYIRIRIEDVEIFRDCSLLTVYATRGVMVTHIDQSGIMHPPQVFPREQVYLTGRFCTWEWNMARVFHEEGWYRDLISGEPKEAWSSSATFGGREYPEQWGLENRLPRPELGLE
jgi:hypothetical protein